jgi:hypothetical protein
MASAAASAALNLTAALTPAATALAPTPSKSSTKDGALADAKASASGSFVVASVGYFAAAAVAAATTTIGVTMYVLRRKRREADEAAAAMRAHRARSSATLRRAPLSLAFTARRNVGLAMSANPLRVDGGTRVTRGIAFELVNPLLQQHGRSSPAPRPLRGRAACSAVGGAATTPAQRPLRAAVGGSAAGSTLSTPARHVGATAAARLTSSLLRE